MLISPPTMTLDEINHISERELFFFFFSQSNQTLPIAILFSFFFLLQAAKQLDSIPDISFHENKE